MKEETAIVIRPEQMAMTSYDAAPADVRLALQTSLYPGAKPESIGMVLGYCRARGLDPLQKPVHIVPMWSKEANRMVDVIMPGIGLYRIQADNTGEHVGTSEPEFGPDRLLKVGNREFRYPEWARITVRRRLPSGTIAEFTVREFWLENYATASKDSDTPNAMWAKRPYGQIAKCAEAQALRRAFPSIGQEVTAEEMDGKVLEPTVVDTREHARRQNGLNTVTDPTPASLLDRARSAPLRDLGPLLKESAAAQDIDAASVLLDRCIERLVKLEPADDRRASIAAHWAPYAPDLHTHYPALSDRLEQIGCPRPTTVAEQEANDVPF